MTDITWNQVAAYLSVDQVHDSNLFEPLSMPVPLPEDGGIAYAMLATFSEEPDPQVIFLDRKPEGYCVSYRASLVEVWDVIATGP